MKNTKRAYRRYKKQVKFVRRVKKWIDHGTHWYYCEDKSKDTFEKLNRSYRKTVFEMREIALEGKTFNFLKTTSCPCSCIMCQPYKYKRGQKQYVTEEVCRELYELNRDAGE